MPDDSDDYHSTPLQDQRAFDTSVRRKPVKFIPAGAPIAAPVAAPVAAPIADTTAPPAQPPAADRYISIVMNRTDKTQSTGSGVTEAHPAQSASSNPLCQICHLPIPSALPHETAGSSRAHEATIAHQVCLTHSHPPSSIDRSGRGYKYLTSYGWDPDSRLGLGADGGGIRAPIRGILKNDTVGLGIETRRDLPQPRNRRMETLDAGKVRKKHEHDRRRGRKLHDMFYRSEEVLKYLG